MITIIITNIVHFTKPYKHLITEVRINTSCYSVLPSLKWAPSVATWNRLRRGTCSSTSTNCVHKAIKNYQEYKLWRTTPGFKTQCGITLSFSQSFFKYCPQRKANCEQWGRMGYRQWSWVTNENIKLIVFLIQFCHGLFDLCGRKIHKWYWEF